MQVRFMYQALLHEWKCLFGIWLVHHLRRVVSSIRESSVKINIKDLLSVSSRWAFSCWILLSSVVKVVISRMKPTISVFLRSHDKRAAIRALLDAIFEELTDRGARFFGWDPSLGGGSFYRQWIAISHMELVRRRLHPTKGSCARVPDPDSGGTMWNPKFWKRKEVVERVGEGDKSFVSWIGSQGMDNMARNVSVTEQLDGSRDFQEVVASELEKLNERDADFLAPPGVPDCPPISLDHSDGNNQDNGKLLQMARWLETLRELQRRAASKPRDGDAHNKTSVSTENFSEAAPLQRVTNEIVRRLQQTDLIVTPDSRIEKARRDSTFGQRQVDAMSVVPDNQRSPANAASNISENNCSHHPGGASGRGGENACSSHKDKKEGITTPCPPSPAIAAHSTVGDGRGELGMSVKEFLIKQGLKFDENGKVTAPDVSEAPGDPEGHVPSEEDDESGNENTTASNPAGQQQDGDERGSDANDHAEDADVGLGVPAHSENMKTVVVESESDEDADDQSSGLRTATDTEEASISPKAEPVGLSGRGEQVTRTRSRPAGKRGKAKGKAQKGMSSYVDLSQV